MNLRTYLRWTASVALVVTIMAVAGSRDRCTEHRSCTTRRPVADGFYRARRLRRPAGHRALSHDGSVDVSATSCSEQHRATTVVHDHRLDRGRVGIRLRPRAVTGGVAERQCSRGICQRRSTTRRRSGRRVLALHDDGMQTESHRLPTGALTASMGVQRSTRSAGTWSADIVANRLARPNDGELGCVPEVRERARREPDLGGGEPVTGDVHIAERRHAHVHRDARARLASEEPSRRSRARDALMNSYATDAVDQSTREGRDRALPARVRNETIGYGGRRHSTRPQTAQSSDGLELRRSSR